MIAHTPWLRMKFYDACGLLRECASHERAAFLGPDGRCSSDMDVGVSLMFQVNRKWAIVWAIRQSESVFDS